MNENDRNPSDSMSGECDGTRAQTGLLQTVLDSLTHPFYVINASDYAIRLANRAAIEMHGAGMATCYALTHSRDRPCDESDHPCPMRMIMETGKHVAVEHIHRDGQGRCHNVEVHGFPIFDERGEVAQVIEYCVDVTEHKRMMEQFRQELEINKALADLADALIDPGFSIEEAADTVLAQARRLTGSEHGYVSSIDPETGANVGHTLTHMMDQQCQMEAARRNTLFYPRRGGRFPCLWGHALNTAQGFYTNAPAEHPASTGLPEGHIPLKNFLAVPALVANAVVGQIALANSERGYSDRDLEAITRMAKLYALAVQRRRAEIALRSSEERYALAQKAAKVGSWDWNIVTGKLLWSERIEPMFGFAAGHFAGTYEAFLACVHCDDRQFVIDSVTACVERGEDYQIEHRVVWPDGTVRWVSETGDVIRDDTGKAIRMLGVVRDITERRQAEEALRREKEKAQRYFDIAGSMLMVLNADQTVEIINARGCELLACKPEEVEGRNWFDCFLPESCRESLRRGFNDYVHGKIPQPRDLLIKGNENPVLCKDGRERMVLWNTSPIYNEDGTEIVAVLSSGEDITERKQAERKIRRLNEELEQRVRERTAELTDANKQLRAEMERRKRLEREILEISEREQRRIGQELHDSLGQQLTGIAIMSKVLQQKLPDLPNEAARAGEIVRLISQAIDETRQLSRGLHPVALDENGLMSALQRLVATTHRVFGIFCTFRCDKPVLVGDASTAVHLYRIAQEAVTNAIRHGKATHILIELRADPSRATLLIENDGRGFPKKVPKNKGMGLQVMGYRAEVIGGILEVRRGPDGGTRVTCTFDAKPKRRKGARKDAAKNTSQH